MKEVLGMNKEGLKVKWAMLQHNIRFYSEFYATCFGFFALQEVTYLLSYFA